MFKVGDTIRRKKRFLNSPLWERNFYNSKETFIVLSITEHGDPKILDKNNELKGVMTACMEKCDKYDKLVERMINDMVHG